MDTERVDAPKKPNEKDRLKSRTASFVKCWTEWRDHHPHFPFVAVGVVALFLIFVFGKDNVWETYKRSRRISTLKKELRLSEEIYKRDSVRLEEIKSNKDGIEQIARERFMMKAEDEDVFIVEDHSSSEEGERRK
ncbi:MAG: septum formation initiator [Porphyromonas sp.]|nr:septum formation initiator [Porphyromonas sp.]